MNFVFFGRRSPPGCRQNPNKPSSSPAKEPLICKGVGLPATNLETLRSAMVAEHLATLHSALIDARAGYKKALEKADDLSVLSQLRAFDSLHAAAHADVHRILLSRGSEFDENGSCIGRMHKAAISVRAAIGGVEEGSLASFASDEEHNIHVYDAAIREEGDNAARTKLVTHREALAAEAAEMKRIAASA